MATDRQSAANRRNAQRSTGPRSAEGKAIASRNAERHGLSAQAARLPDHEQRIEALARLIAGDAPAPTELDYARTAATAALQISHIRMLRAALLEPAARQREVYFPRQASWKMKYAPPKSWVMMRSAQLQDIARQLEEQMSFEEKVEKYTTITRSPPPLPPGARAEAALRPRMLAEALKLDRYERREISRRKTAIRQLDRLREARLQPTDGGLK